MPTLTACMPRHSSGLHSCAYLLFLAMKFAAVAARYSPWPPKFSNQRASTPVFPQVVSTHEGNSPTPRRLRRARPRLNACSSPRLPTDTRKKRHPKVPVANLSINLICSGWLALAGNNTRDTERQTDQRKGAWLWYRGNGERLIRICLPDISNTGIRANNANTVKGGRACPSCSCSAELQR